MTDDEKREIYEYNEFLRNQAFDEDEDTEEEEETGIMAEKKVKMRSIQSILHMRK
eukprot:CAMPEP_0178955530 /NCGR_PEP_ID=MMETSP0789-20121207/9660_1 /TAXON_ID=3005 /ORGANISM="Rhizosolenia setigera, Strain CCMP 1694" /LENGTH=54 /DNA_ID=CAMNT_0020637179 /DNA_START=643 /DNA_END=807 /DNA_ORIENTATION=-